MSAEDIIRSPAASSPDESSDPADVWRAPEGIFSRNSTDEMFDYNFRAILPPPNNYPEYHTVVSLLKDEYHALARQSGFDEAGIVLHQKIIEVFYQK